MLASCWRMPKIWPPKTPSTSTWDQRCSRSLGHHCRWDSAAARDVFGIHQWWGANSGGWEHELRFFCFEALFQMKPGCSFWKGTVGWKEKQSEVAFLWFFQNTVCLCLAGWQKKRTSIEVSPLKDGVGRTTWHGFPYRASSLHKYQHSEHLLYIHHIYFYSRKPGRTRVIPRQHPI